jgi:hypothetical protein
MVWGAGYVILPVAKLYKPIWEYDARTLADDLSAQLVYGLATAASFRLITSPVMGRNHVRHKRWGIPGTPQTGPVWRGLDA